METLPQIKGNLITDILQHGLKLEMLLGHLRGDFDD
nr:unnamed protein product [Callosobruchus analis]